MADTRTMTAVALADACALVIRIRSTRALAAAGAAANGPPCPCPVVLVRRTGALLTDCQPDCPSKYCQGLRAYIEKRCLDFMRRQWAAEIESWSR